MSGLYGVLQREAERFPELWNLVRQLEEWIRSCERLRTELEQLLQDVLSVDPSCTIVVATGHSLARFIRSIVLGTGFYVGTEMIKVVIKGREFRIPSCPPRFSVDVNSWMEFPGKGEVLVKAIELDLPFHFLETTLTVVYEFQNSLASEQLSEDLHKDFLVSLLARFEGPIEKMMRDALADLKRYHRELEELKNQILRDYPREILMGDL
jgi:uncharacterized protein YjiS (DUF1127 family)